MKLTDEMLAVLNDIPGGVCIYRIKNGGIIPVFYNAAFCNMIGCSAAHREQIEHEMNFLGVHEEDLPAVREKVKCMMQDGKAFTHLCRIYNDRLDEYRWIRISGSLVRQEDGECLMYGVCSDISEQKQLEIETNEAKERIKHLVNSLPGGIASYRAAAGRLQTVFVSDGVIRLSGYSRTEYERITRDDVIALVYEQDRPRVLAAVKQVTCSREDTDVSCRIRRKDGRLIWVHMNGRRLHAGDGVTEISVVITGMSEETHLFQRIANETADGIYVIDRENYDLLYVNEYKELFAGGRDCVGRKCYEALHGMDAPCTFCTLDSRPPDGTAHAMSVPGDARFFSTRFRETDWSGIPAYVKYVRDVTAAENVRIEKERIENYFRTLVKNLPGGVAVIRCEPGGRMAPEFLSDGFADMTGMTLQQAWALYRDDALAGMHPDDKQRTAALVGEYLSHGETRYELTYRLLKGDGSYFWVKNTLSMLPSEDECHHIYAVYQDMTGEMERQERLRQKYQEIILQHYRAPEPNTLALGHCNVTQGVIHDVLDYTDCNLLGTFGNQRDNFFAGLSGFIVDAAERRAFLDNYLSQPALKAFARGETEQRMECFIRLPSDVCGRYAQFQMNLIATPDSNDVTGILTVSDVTERTVADCILQQISTAGYEFVIDIDLTKDRYCLIASNAPDSGAPPEQGAHSSWISYMQSERVVPKDREQYRSNLAPDQMLERLQRGGAYTFAFSMYDPSGEILTKNVTVSPIDLRIGRVCLVCTDITDSVREQQGMLNMMAYAFEMMSYINVGSGRLTLYTRRTVLENLPPYTAQDYKEALVYIVEPCAQGDSGQAEEEVRAQLNMETMLRRLEEKPTGYDFVFACQTEEGLRYKQINVLWGDINHSTICMVRADATDILTAERQSKKALEDALVMAREANLAKSDFLSSMSHDIRTPMNAIMGMTELALAHRDDPARVEDCLQKISTSSRHLLSLINDILDMSKIERAQITLNRIPFTMTELLQQVSDIMAPQAEAAGLEFTICEQGALQENVYGDTLRINQVLLNILSNAIKFTPKGGRVTLLVEEIPAVKDAQAMRFCFTVSDTGIGMPEEFFQHLFEPFSRSRAAAKVEGTGLGLSITKGLVDLMGGVLVAESRENEGSTFRVELECARAPADAVWQAALGENAADGAQEKTLFLGRRFLVAEDNAINAEILCEMLKLYGADCVVRTDGAQAVQAFQDAAPGTYDAILMDIQMPEVDGYAATRRIRSLDRPDARTLPIIAMTANAFAEDVQAAMDAGMDGHVAKPLDVAMLRDTLQRALNRTH